MTRQNTTPAKVLHVTLPASDRQEHLQNGRPGPIWLALLLTNENGNEKQSLYLGQEAIVSAEPEHFSFKTEPVVETLHFPVPANPAMRQFSAITVLVLPEIQRRFVAPRIAIRQFQIFPR
jgi:hypothetical protein